MRTAVLYLRSLLPEAGCSHQTVVCEHLDALTDQGRLDEWSAHVWGRQGPATPAAARTDAGRFALNRVAVFQEWARRNDRSLAPAFTIREVDASITDRHYRAIVFPQVLLAEYEDEALTCVTPHASAAGVISVRDRLADLASETPPDFVPMAQAAPDTRPSATIDAAAPPGDQFDPHIAEN